MDQAILAASTTHSAIATQLQRLSTLLFGEAVNGAYPTARLTNLSAQHQEGVPFDTCRDKVPPSPAFLYKVSEGYSILRAEVEEHFESNLPGQWKPTFDIYLKPSNNAKQKQFEVVCQETAALLAQLKDVWKRARQRHNGQAGFELELFVYVPKPEAHASLRQKKASNSLNAVLTREVDGTFACTLYETLQNTSSWDLYDQIRLYGFDSAQIGEQLRHLAYVKEQTLK
ncbi:hypothetical protein JG687_00017403, partial [Phytophthora cactorum]